MSFARSKGSGKDRGGGGGGEGASNGAKAFSSFPSNSSAARPAFATSSNGDRPSSGPSGAADPRQRRIWQAVDETMGVETLAPRETKIGWLINMVEASVLKQEEDASGVSGIGVAAAREVAALDVYFIQTDGTTFKSTLSFEPYFYVRAATAVATRSAKPALERHLSQFLKRSEVVTLTDLEQPNHLSGKKQTFLKLSFRTTRDLQGARRALMFAMSRKTSTVNYQNPGASATAPKAGEDPLAVFTDIREYDVPYAQRVCIDKGIHAGSWYQVTEGGDFGCVITKLDRLEKAEPRVLAFDIECTKAPLKFPDAAHDEIFMISYMRDGSQGKLITSLSVVSKPVPDFEYTPRPEFVGKFEVENCPNEESLIRCFFDLVKEMKPHIFVTYNGDSFDWPFLETRAKVYGWNMAEEIGIAASMPPGSGGPNNKANPTTPLKDEQEEEAPEENPEPYDEDDNEGKPSGKADAPAASSAPLFSSAEYRGRCAVHLDCLAWVKRDSYLPAGSRGLKHVTKAKLGYDPVEIDPEDMQREAAERPIQMASYSVSDAVATYYLYDKYVHLFIFSLGTILPMSPEDVLRKGSGTLCEFLLMIEAFQKRIVCPNKQTELDVKLFKNSRLIESETYVGGHVECLESGVFRHDISCDFDNLDPTAFEELKSNVVRDLRFAIEVEGNMRVEDCVNFESVTKAITDKLEDLRAAPRRKDFPRIYHLDVGAMYPNIILTNRLQPIAMVNETTCASCDFNRPESDCKRKMPWEWRGEVFMGKHSEYRAATLQLESEDPMNKGFNLLPPSERKRVALARFKLLCQNSYSRVKETILEDRHATVCQRENPFYVDTVRAFRDRRNEYKASSKQWTKTKKASKSEDERIDAENKVLLYDSLQLAHKCILNSFYGYVMRKGARWHSMEMAAVVTKTGANLIKQARQLVERVGRPLELDTDGIWCILPASFPENFTLEFRDGTNYPITYPCLMLNADVHANFTNAQYQTLDESTGEYTKRSECSIFFEIDGPYSGMVIPASHEEGKLLKKRYAVFNFKGALSELKGFEMKRRGELKIIKIFQSQVFEKFLCGTTLETCYQAVAEIANYWLDVLYTKGASLSDEEVIDLLSENRSMSKSLVEYGDQKSTSITTARRLAQFLGPAMTREKGLACKLLISNRPHGAPTTERAVPTAIFSADCATKDSFLRQWLKDFSLPSDVDVREVIDWEYYVDRLGKAVQKIITIPAALQRVANPVPRLKHPDWLARVVREQNDSRKQARLDEMLFGRRLTATTSAKKRPSETIADLEDVMTMDSAEKRRRKIVTDEEEDESSNEEEDVDLTELNQTLQREGRRLNQKLDDDGMEIIDDEATTRDRVRERLATWRARRQAAKKNAKAAALASLPLKPPSSILALGAAQHEASERSTWEIVEVRPAMDGEPGVFCVFVADARGAVRSLYVRARRTLFVDSAADDEETVKGVERTRDNSSLPHGRRPRFLSKLVLDERVFKRNPKEFSNYVTKSSVLGVYESKIPLAHRLVCDVGNTVKLSPPTPLPHPRPTGKRGDPYPSEWLAKTNASSTYLSNTPYRRGFLFLHQLDANRVMSAVVFMDDEERHDGRVVPARATAGHVVYFEGAASHASSRVSKNGAHIDSMIRRASHQYVREPAAPFSPEEEAELLSARDDVDFQCAQWTVRSEASLAGLYARIDGFVSARATDKSKHPLILLVSCPDGGKHEILSRFSSSLLSVPVVELPSAETSTMNPIQWKQEMLKLFSMRFVHHVHWWSNRVKAARYARTPVASIGEDVAMSLSDVIFSRNLKENKIISWASPGGVPDLGGAEEDVSKLIAYETSSEQQTIVGRRGSYGSICVDLDVSLLAMNAILVAKELIDIECVGGSLAFGGPEGSDLVDDASLLEDVKPAFDVLRAAVVGWHHDAGSALSSLPVKEMASLLCVHLHRWLASPRSMLHDPSLFRYVTDLMRKVFLQLVQHLQSLGSIVVSGNFQRIVLCTRKSDLRGAQAYVAHVLEVLRGNKLFAHLQLDPKRFWRRFLYWDQANFAGVYYPPEDADELPSQGSAKEVVMTRVSSWNIAKHLPPSICKDFESMIVEFVANGVHETDREEEDDEDEAGAEPANHEILDDYARDTPANPAAEDSELHGDSISTSKKRVQSWITNMLGPWLLRRVNEIRLLPPHLKRFPRLIGSHLTLHDPALEFVKTCCAVLSLEKHAVDTVRVLKRQALTMLQVNEFDEQAQFKDPSTSLVLPALICGSCQTCDDLDLCRTEEPMICGVCGNQRDEASIEATLVDNLQKACLMYQLQDLICAKCHQVRPDNLSEFCVCSGGWMLRKQRNAEELTAYASVAKACRFEWLREVVCFLDPERAGFFQTHEVLDESVYSEHPAHRLDEEDDMQEQEEEEELSVGDSDTE